LKGGRAEVGLDVDGGAVGEVVVGLGVVGFEVGRAEVGLVLGLDVIGGIVMNSPFFEGEFVGAFVVGLDVVG
jgi:hypothetical protein